MKKLIGVFGILFLLTVYMSAQSKVVKNFEENANGYKAFAYQSVLRMLNQDQNPEFNKLIRNLDHIRLVTTDSTGVLALKSFKQLDKGIRGEGFEELLTFNNKEYKCHVYELSSKNKKTTWVATFYAQGRAGLLEMVGSLDMKYISALSSLSMDQLQELIPDAAGMDWD